MDLIGIGPLEIFIVLIVALLVLGPNKMLDTARGLGKMMREFRNATSEVVKAIEGEEEPPTRRGTDRPSAPEGKSTGETQEEETEGEGPRGPA